MIFLITSLLFYIFLLKKLKQQNIKFGLNYKNEIKNNYFICDEPLCL